jgi:hypothetical protein
LRALRSAIYLEACLNVRSWPIATDMHVRRHVSGQGKSGLAVLYVSLVARDPKRSF